MKKSFLLLLFVLRGISLCFGQTIHELNKDTSKYKDSPLVIIDYLNTKYITQTASLFFLDPNKIDSVAVLKEGTILNQYGPQAKNGVIKIKLKAKIDFVDINTLFKKYNIKDQDLPVFLDSSIVCRPKIIYFVLKDIKYIKVEEEESTGMRYISIRTTFPLSRPSKSGIYLRGAAKL